MRNQDDPNPGCKHQWRSPGDSDVACFNSLDELPPGITALFSAAESRSFDLGLDWFRLLIQTTFSPADRVKVYAVSARGEGAKAALVLQYQGDGSRLYALTNFYSALYGPAVAQDDSTESLAECFHAIRHGNPAVTLLKLQPLDRSGHDYDQLKMALSRAGWIVFGFFVLVTGIDQRPNLDIRLFLIVCHPDCVIPLKGRGGRLPQEVVSLLK
ncbi:MAG: hypothetical protein MZV65_28085 [Chromatiales bacterium]|nr:hypothetical protein [Chromatiales bacterium]